MRIIADFAAKNDTTIKRTSFKRNCSSLYFEQVGRIGRGLFLLQITQSQTESGSYHLFVLDLEREIYDINPNNKRALISFTPIILLASINHVYKLSCFLCLYMCKDVNLVSVSYLHESKLSFI